MCLSNKNVWHLSAKYLVEQRHRFILRYQSIYFVPSLEAVESDQRSEAGIFIDYLQLYRPYPVEHFDTKHRPSILGMARYI